MNSAVGIPKSEPMRVSHLCTDIRGGAARSMLNLHHGLLSQGIESSVITAADIEKQSPWHAAYHRKYVAERLVWSNRTELSNSHFSLDYLGNDVGGYWDIRKADIIHLHWVAEFLTSESMFRIAALGKPMVWTLHDMRPFTGGCHFPAGCEDFKTDCSECPQLLSNYFDITKHALRATTEALESQNITFVAPSVWIADEFKASRMGRRHEIRVVPYGVDTSLFVRQSRALARKALGLSNDARYILLASNSFSEKRKGLELASQVLAKFHALSLQSGQPAQNVRLLFCGEASPQIAGWIADSVGFVPPETMPMVYSAADVMLFTPLEDNLPNVALEAMACELPIVSHRVGGIPDMLDGLGGMFSLPEQGDVTGMASLLVNFVQGPEDLLQQVGQSERQTVLSRFTISGQASAYVDLYGQAMDRRVLASRSTLDTTEQKCRVSKNLFYPRLAEDLVISPKKTPGESSLATLHRAVERKAIFQDELEELRRKSWPWILRPRAWRARLGRSRANKDVLLAERAVLRLNTLNRDVKQS
jgi:glycosyltransferase involved in cell wall biosynthesis